MKNSLSQKLILSCALICFSPFAVLKAQNAEKGAELFKQCISCHGQNGEGNPAMKAPKLSGQYDWYILKQLKDKKAQKLRKNEAMMPFLNKLSETDMADLALYISKLSI